MPTYDISTSLAKLYYIVWRRSRCWLSAKIISHKQKTNKNQHNVRSCSTNSACKWYSKSNFYTKNLWNPCMHEVMWTRENQQNKSQLSFSLFVYFPVAAHAGLVKLIYLNDLLADITFLLLTNQGSWFCLGSPVGQSASGRSAGPNLPCMEVVHIT